MKMNKIYSLILILTLFFAPCTVLAAQMTLVPNPEQNMQNVADKKTQTTKKTDNKKQKSKKTASSKDKKEVKKQKTKINKTEKKDAVKTVKPKKSKKLNTKKDTNKTKAQQKTSQKKFNIFGKNVDYSEYLIPSDGYMPVGGPDDKSIKISGSVQKTMELNLADCLELALINNPKIKAAYANAAAVKTHKYQTVANYTPRVDLKGGFSRIKPDMSTFRGGSSGQTFKIDPFTKYMLGTLSVKQLVYDFGLTQNQYTIDKLEYDSSKSNIDSVVNEVICQVKDSYYNLLYKIEAKRVAQETVEQFEQTYNQAKAFYDVGVKPKVDVTIAETNLADARANYITASNDVDIAVSGLNNAMGLPFVPPYIIDTKIPYQEPDITMRKAVEIANESRPDLKIALLNVKQADQYVKLSKKTYFPSIEFQGNWSVGGRDSATDTNWYDIGGYLTFPTVNPFKTINEIKEAKALYEKQQYDTKAQVNDIYYDIQQTYVKLVDAQQRIPVTKLSVRKARENYELSQGRYRVGECDAIELKDAQIQYQNSRLAYLSALYQFNSAKAYLEKAIGQTIKPKENGENSETEI